MVELDIPFSVLFTLCALLMVVGVFCFVWFRGQRMSNDEQASQFDASESLLVCLTVLAVIVLLGSMLLLFFESHFYN